MSGAQTQAQQAYKDARWLNLQATGRRALANAATDIGIAAMERAEEVAKDVGAMNDQPEHVEPLWSRFDDLAERHESFNAVLGLHSSQIGVVQRTLDDLSREMADRFHGATSTFGNLNDRIHELEAQVSRVIDLVAYQAQPDGGPVAAVTDEPIVCSACGHHEDSHGITVGCIVDHCNCSAFRPAVTEKPCNRIVAVDDLVRLRSLWRTRAFPDTTEEVDVWLDGIDALIAGDES